MAWAMTDRDGAFRFARRHHLDDSVRIMVNTSDGAVQGEPFQIATAGAVVTTPELQLRCASGDRGRRVRRRARPARRARVAARLGPRQRRATQRQRYGGHHRSARALSLSRRAPGGAYLQLLDAPVNDTCRVARSTVRRRSRQDARSTSAAGEVMFVPSLSSAAPAFRATRLGAGDVADRSLPKVAQCVATLIRALDAGVNVVDTAPNYEDGLSEDRRRGPCAGAATACSSSTRSITCTSPSRRRSNGASRVCASRVDLFVFHSCSKLTDLDRLLAPAAASSSSRTRSAAAACLPRHQQPPPGRARESATRRRVRRRDVRSVRSPTRATNATCCRSRRRAGRHRVLQDVRRRQAAWRQRGYQRPLAPRAPPRRCRGSRSTNACYTLTIDPDVALLGLSTPAEQDAAWAAVSTFAPMGAAELAATRERASSAIAGKGDVWWNPSA